MGYLTPIVIERTGRGERSYDIWSRLLKDRIVFLGMPIDDYVANLVIAQILFLQTENKNQDINLESIAICLVGDFTRRPPSSVQMAALASLVQQLRAYYHIPANRVIRHRDVPGKNTACPGARFPWAAFAARLE